MIPPWHWWQQRHGRQAKVYVLSWDSKVQHGTAQLWIEHLAANQCNLALL